MRFGCNRQTPQFSMVKPAHLELKHPRPWVRRRPKFQLQWFPKLLLHQPHWSAARYPQIPSSAVLHRALHPST